MFPIAFVPNGFINFKYVGLGLTCLYLLLQLLKLLFGTLELCLLCGHLLLEILLLFLSLLNLIADQGAADQAYCSANTGAYARVSRGAADDSSQTGAGTGPDDRALLGRG